MPIDADVQNRELFVGLIAPLGVDLGLVIQTLQRALQRVSYDTETVHLTTFLTASHEQYDGLNERYGALIHAGNEFRADTVPDVFSYLAIQEINRKRKVAGRSVQDRRVTIIRQFKRPEEIELLRSVYGANVLFLSCYAPRSVRVKYFVDRFASESRAQSRTHYEAQALELISKDEHESDDPNGQRLLETYAKADFVADCTTPQALAATIDRFVEAFFGFPFISPSHDEYGAYMAYSASLRSSDLSRQVGAAIFKPDGEIVSLGCNEVPKFGGGTYWTEDANDARDFRLVSIRKRQAVDIA